MTTAPRFRSRKNSLTKGSLIARGALITVALVGVAALTSFPILAQSPLGQELLSQTSTQPPAPTQTPTPSPVSDSAASLITPDGQVLTETPNNIVLTAIPPRLGDDGDLKAKPGEKIQALVRIRNSSDKALPITTMVNDFIIGQDGKTPIQVSNEVSNRWSLASWVTVSPTTQIVQPRQTAQVSLLISVPNDALPGGHYAMVMHEPNQGANNRGDSALTEPQSVISQRVGSLLYFKVEGPINEDAYVRNLQIPRLTEYGPVPFTFTVENVSDIHIKPQITVEVSDMFGRVVDTINLDEMNVFPLVSRDYQGQWDRVWGMGRYTAQVKMTYGSEGRVALASAGFWLIPYKLVAAVGTAILVLLVVTMLVRRHVIHRRKDEKNKIDALEKRLAEFEGRTTPSDQTPTDFET